MSKSKGMKPLKLVALILMLIPGISLIGVLIYLIGIGRNGMGVLELVLILLTIPFGFIAAIFLWLNAFGIINL